MAKQRTAPTCIGAPCPKCGGTVRYVTSRGCVNSACHLRRQKKRTEREIRKDFAAQIYGIVNRWNTSLKVSRQ